MSDIFGSIAHILGGLLLFLYNNLWFSYGLAIILLTIIIKSVLLPLSIKSFKSMAKMHEVQPVLNEIQRKYKNDKEALNREMMKVYKEKKINPFGGCLPMLLQIPILYGLFLVISQPLTFMYNYPEISKTQIFAKYVSVNSYYKEVEFLVKAQDNKKILEDVEKEIKEKNKITKDYANLKNMNLIFLGINLGDIPKIIPPKDNTTKYIILWIIPILAGVSTYYSSKFSQMPTQQIEQSEIQSSMQKQMMIMMPLMAAYFSFVVPVGLSLYWLISNIYQLIQQKYLINLYINKKEA